MIYRLPDHSIEKMIAIGNPAQYIVMATAQQKAVHAQAQRIETYPKKNKILFIGDGKISSDKNTLVGPRIEYQMNTQNILTTPSPQHSSRVYIQAN
jgi:lipopolysaccharide transport protein LptA